MGQNAGNGASNASYSNLFGYQTGKTFTSNNIGSNNIIIGTNISLPNATSNAINIGGVLFGTGTYSTLTGNPSTVPVSTGKIGIGDSTPAALLTVGNGDLFQVNSSGAIAAVVGITNTGTFNTTVNSATALVVAQSGSNYAFQVDTSTASSVTGIKLQSAAAGGGVALSVISTGTDENLNISAKGAGAIALTGSAYTLAGSGASTTALNIGSSGTTSGILNLIGRTSGTISVLSQPAAGTYNFNLPTTAGTSGYVLTSAGGGSSAMTWTDPSTFVPAWSSITAPTGNLSLAHGANTTSFTFNGVTTGTAFSLSSTSLTTGFIQSSTLGSSLTTGGALSITGANYNHTGSETGKLISLSFTDSSSNTGLTSAVTTGIDIAPTISTTASAGTKTINAINVSPSYSSCGTAAGTCFFNGVQLSTPTITQTTANTLRLRGTNISSAGPLTQNTASGVLDWVGHTVTMPNITQTTGSVAAVGFDVNTGSITTGGFQQALRISSSGVAAGTLLGISIVPITGGAGTETAISIGSGWDTAISSAGNYVQSAGTMSVTSSNTTQTTTSSVSAFNANSVNSGTGVYISTTALTSGNSLQIQGSGATMTTSGELIDLALGANTVGAGITITSTGAYTGVGSADGLINIVANSLTSGLGSQYSFTGLTSGSGLLITGGTSMTTNGELIDLNMGAATAGNGINIRTTGVYTGTGLAVITANSATTGTIQALSATGLTTGFLQSSTLGSALTTGGYLNMTGASYNTVAGGTGNAINLAYTNSATNTSGTAIVTGINISPTINAVGVGGTQETYGIYVQAASGSPGGGTQSVYGIRIGNQGVTGAENAYGLYIDNQINSSVLRYGIYVVNNSSDVALNVTTTDCSTCYGVKVEKIGNNGVGIGIGEVANNTSSTFTGSYIKAGGGTITYPSGGTESGNYLVLDRNRVISSGTLNLSGNLATLSSTCSGAGTCTDTGKILQLTQSYASASGDVLNIAGAGTGNLITADATSSSANGASIDIQSSSSSQYALRVTSNNGSTNSLYVAGDGTVIIGSNAAAAAGMLTVRGTATSSTNLALTSGFTDTVSGTFLSIPAANVLSAGKGISISGTGVGSAITDFTGTYLSINPAKNYSGASTFTSSGNYMNVARSLANSGSGTYSITGNLVDLSSNCTVSSGACTDSSKVLQLTQSYASASGAVLAISNSGTGVDILGTSSTWQVTKAGAATLVGITSSSNYVQSAGTMSVTSANTTQSTTSSALALNVNSLTSGTGLNVASSSVTSGSVVNLSGGTAMTTGSMLNIGSTTYNHGNTVETGSALNIAFTDASNGTGLGTTNGINVTPTINVTTGASGQRNINGIKVSVPTITGCSGVGYCNYIGLNVDTTGSINGNIYSAVFNGGNVGIGTSAPGTALEIGTSDLGNGTAGPVITLGRNNNGTNTGAGSINFQSKAGTAGYVWQDNAGNLRINTAAPSNANDTAGTVVGAQTSTRNTKQDITDYTDFGAALQMVTSAPLHTFRYIKDVQGYGADSPLAKKRIGYIADEVSADFMWGSTIDQVSVNGILMASIKALNDKIGKISNPTLVFGQPNLANASIVLESQLYLSGDNVGEAKILAGVTSVRVTFSKPYQYQPIVTATPNGRVGSEYWVSDKDSTGFTINIDLPSVNEVVFDWHSFGSSTAKLTVSDGSSLDIPLIVSVGDAGQAVNTSPLDEPINSGVVAGDVTTVPDLVLPSQPEPAPVAPANPPAPPVTPEPFNPRG